MPNGRLIRRILIMLETVPPFLAIAFSRRGLLSRDGRQLIAGKFRRIFISAFPPLARFLRRKYGLSGGCIGCGASCNLLFQCPHWDAKTHLCSVYEDRPNICRLFPMTPGDIRDRNLVAAKIGCGFRFTGAPVPGSQRVGTGWPSPARIPAFPKKPLNIPGDDVE